MSHLTVSLLAAALATDGVRLGGTWFEAPMRRVVRAAAVRLADPACARVLSRFRDGSGRALEERLGQLQQDAASYTRGVLFYDGSSEPACRRPRVFAFTHPGSRVVRVCSSLGWLATVEPERAEAIVIHEVLHTLGLRENPPASEEITAVVEKHCGR